MSRLSKTGRTVWREENARIVTMLREAREKAGLSQGHLAAKLGRNQSYVSKLERGAQGIEVVELIDYCRAVDVAVSDLLRDF